MGRENSANVPTSEATSSPAFGVRLQAPSKTGLLTTGTITVMSPAAITTPPSRPREA